MSLKWEWEKVPDMKTQTYHIHQWATNRLGADQDNTLTNRQTRYWLWSFNELFSNAVHHFVQRRWNEAHKESNTLANSESIVEVLCCFWYWGCWIYQSNDEIRRLQRHFTEKLPSVRKLGLRQRLSVFQQHKSMVAKEKMYYFKLTSNEFLPKSNWKPLERAEICLCIRTHANLQALECIMEEWQKLTSATRWLQDMFTGCHCCPYTSEEPITVSRVYLHFWCHNMKAFFQ